MELYKKRGIRTGLALLCSLAVILSILPANAANDEIENLENQTSALENELEGINQDILDLSEEISSTEMQVEILNGEILKTSDNLKQAEESLRDELKKAYENGITEQELAEAKRGLIESRAVSRAQDPVLAANWVNYLELGRDWRFSKATEEAIAKLQPVILLSGTNEEKLAALRPILNGSTGMKGIEELEFIFDKIKNIPLTAELELDLTLARGLNYYTGAIFEVKALDVQIGSITGGGRYDNLTGVFGLEGVSGVGISFGADRIYDVLNQLDLYPKDALQTTQLLFVNFGPTEESYLLPLIAKVRAAGIRTELYPEAAKMKKQMSYADTKRIPFVALVGENEIKENKINLKNMLTGEQCLVSLDELLEKFR